MRVKNTEAGEPGVPAWMADAAEGGGEGGAGDASGAWYQFPGRRSVVHGTRGMVACTQPLAARCGIRVLEKGGNAAVSDHFFSSSFVSLS